MDALARLRSWRPLASGGIALLVSAVLRVPGAGATETAASNQVIALSTRDRTLIVQAACIQQGSTGADRVEGLRQRGSRPLKVEVECKPHTTTHSVPVARHTSCDNAQGSWRCEPARDALIVPLPNDTTVPVLPEGVPSPSALEAIREAAKLTIRPFYRPAVNVMKGRCTVGETRTSTSKGMQSFQIRCGETLIVLTRDCWDDQCRYFIPFAQNY
jgi:hypothetical protein